MGIQFRKRNSSLIIGVLSVVIVALLIWIQVLRNDLAHHRDLVKWNQPVRYAHLALRDKLVDVISASDVNSSMVIGISKIIQDLDPTYVVSQERSQLCHSDLVCDEVYLGNIADLPWHEKAWQLDSNCSRNVDLSSLITILILEEDGVDVNCLLQDLASSPSYREIPIIYGHYTKQPPKTKLTNVSFKKYSKREGRGEHWKDLVSSANTPFALVGHHLRRFHPEYVSLERSIRLIDDGSLVAAVGGATKNEAGLWRSHCWQSEVQRHTFILTPGYRKSSCDCMVCSTLWDNFGPFVARTQDLKARLNTNLDSVPLMFMDYFVKNIRTGKNVYSCPDILYSTTSEDVSEAAPSNSQWRKFAIEWEVQGIAVDLGPEKIHTFSCSEVGLTCEPESQTASYLVPWCCVQSFNHVVATMDSVSTKLGVHYELNSGSVLGAVKLNNFLPWDIDGDFYVPTHELVHFHKGGKARKILEIEGITLFGWSEDNYWDMGAGHYQMSYGGLEFELMGKRGNLTLKDVEASTRILVGSTWAKVHNHPGQYLRGRYGSGYLEHAQSWRFVPSMDSAYDAYGAKSSAWSQCEKPGHHACLEFYPRDGNIEFLPHRYP